MATQKKARASVVAGGAGETLIQGIYAANSNPWTRWARKARTDRLSDRQRRAVRLMAASPRLTPEIALGAVEGQP